jgi:ADP-ribose pyrophosphatase YjhB (NUDIX family)
MQYCIECGAKLETKEIETRRRLVCRQCGRIHYQNPLPVVVGVLSKDDGEILLIRRAIDPGKGEWALPGGFIEEDESPQEAVLREIEEEIGIKGELAGLVGVYRSKSELYGAVIIIGYKITVQSRGYCPGKEVSEIKSFLKNHLPPLVFSSHKEIISDSFRTFRNPVPTVDTIVKMDKGIVLINRKNPPFGWALPGGFVNYGESLEKAARRETKEETNLDIKELRQFRVYSSPQRDPRCHTITTVFTATSQGKPKARDDAKKIKVFRREELPQDLAFDHRQILEDYFASKE